MIIGGEIVGSNKLPLSGRVCKAKIQGTVLLYTERKKFSKCFTSLVFVYKSMSLKRFRIEQFCPSVYSMNSLVFVHYAIM